MERFAEQARNDLLYVTMRVLEITARYFQFRIREMVARGIYLEHRYDMRIEGNRVTLVLEAEVPEWLVETYMKRYREMARIVRKLIRNAKIVDRHNTRARAVEEMEGVEFDEYKP